MSDDQQEIDRLSDDAKAVAEHGPIVWNLAREDGEAIVHRDGHQRFVSRGQNP